MWKEIMLCDIVRETAFAVHCHHKNGHLEKVYEYALAGSPALVWKTTLFLCSGFCAFSRLIIGQ
jgi:hypothetical protein